MRACPKCGNTAILVQRKKNPDGVCIACVHHAPAEEFRKTKSESSKQAMASEAAEKFASTCHISDMGDEAIQAAFFEVRRMAYLRGFEKGYEEGFRVGRIPQGAPFDP